MSTPGKRSLVIVLLLAVAAVSAYSQTKTMSVTVRQAPVRATPTFLGKILTDLAYGDQVEVVETQGAWVKIKLPGGQGTGWMHSSELTQQQLALKAGSNVKQGASGSEVALAGKGFNKQVEDKYASEKHLDYSKVDEMEKIAYPPARLIQFLEAGDLHGGQN